MSNALQTGTTSRTVLGAWGLFAAVLLVMLGNGMLGTLLGVRAELEGFSTTVTGVVLAGYYMGFLAGAWGVPKLIGTVGHIRVYAALASLASTATLIHIMTSNPIAWGAARLVTGFALSGLYIVAESWLNDRATNETRGRLLSVYMVVVMGGIAVAQLLLTVADPSGVTLFVLASVLISVAVIPITLSATQAPELFPSAGLPIRRIWRAAPLGLYAGFGQGVGVGALVSLGAVYAQRIGMSIDRTAFFMAIAIVGSVVLQPPIGILSDRIRRRRAIVLVATLAGAASLWMVSLDGTSNLALVVVFLIGGLVFPMYSLALTHVNDQVPTGEAVDVSSVYVFFTGFGAILGPILAAVMIDVIGPNGLFWLVAAVNISIAVFAVVRIAVREGVPVHDQLSYLFVPARAGTVILQVARMARQPVEAAKAAVEARRNGK